MSTTSDTPAMRVPTDLAVPATPPAKAEINAEVFARLSHLFRRAGTGATTQALFGALYQARSTQRRED